MLSTQTFIDCLINLCFKELENIYGRNYLKRATIQVFISYFHVMELVTKHMVEYERCLKDKRHLLLLLESWKQRLVMATRQFFKKQRRDPYQSDIRAILRLK